jgi:hypothetical protein
MKKYIVHVYEPTVYEVEANSKEEAETQAVELYKQEKNTWLTPGKVEATEVPTK